MSDSLVKVKVLRSHPAYAYFAGDEAEISRAQVDKINAAGPFFEEIKAKSRAAQPETADVQAVVETAEAPKTAPKHAKKPKVQAE